MGNQTIPSQIVIPRLNRVKKSGNGWSACCPAHHDRKNSLSIKEDKDGRLLIKCHAGCPIERITNALNLQVRDLFPSKQELHMEGNAAITLAQLAKDKGLPESFLRELGVAEIKQGVRITYRLEDGSPASRQRLRTALKAKDGSFWEKGNDSPVAYGLWKLDEARKAGFLVFVEGESDPWTLWFSKYPVLGLPGADMANKIQPQYLQDITVLYVVQEPDQGGTTFVKGIARRLKEIGFTGRAFVITMPDGIKDPNDLYKQCPAKFKTIFDDLLAHAKPLGLHNKKAKTKDTQEEEKKRKPSQAQILVELAADVELFHTPASKGYATLEVNGHQQTWPIRCKTFREIMVRRFYQSQGKPPSSQAMQDALGVLDAKAQFDGAKMDVFVRVAECNGNIYIDMVNDNWQAIEVTPYGWQVINNPPVKFKRANGMLPLPCPKQGGSLELLKEFINISNEEDWRLLIGWLIGALRPVGPKPILIIQGEQGSAKSTLARLLRCLLDPSTATMRSTPKEERDLMIAAVHGWVMSFDNLSSLPAWVSDALCRLSTGGGFSTRKLYTDDEEEIFDAMRPVILTGIDDLATRHDLADRSIILTLSPIQDKQRKREDKLWSSFEKARPMLLGAILDAISSALLNLAKTELESLPRMADFATWVTAAEAKLPWAKGDFLQAYDSNRRDLVQKALESDLVALAVCALVHARQEWNGTATELLDILPKYSSTQSQRSRSWPQSSRALSNQLRRVATFLRAGGIQVQFCQTGGGHDNRRIIKLVKLE